VNGSSRRADEEALMTGDQQAAAKDVAAADAS
jgi:hypothetical protein